MNKSIEESAVNLLHLYWKFKYIFGEKGADKLMHLVFGDLWTDNVKKIFHNTIHTAEERITMQSFGQFMERIDKEVLP